MKKTAIEEYRELFKTKIEYYGLTEAAIEFAIEEILTKEKQECEDLVKEVCIDFGRWYSGMDFVKVDKAYERFIRETTN